MPNSLHKIPRRNLGLSITTTCMDVPRLSCLIPQYSPFWGKRFRAGQSGRVSRISSAPSRTETVMQPEPAAYSLLTPSGYPMVSSASVSS